ncbi:hypothetical protein CYMTET_43929 [Cymbomonas tetramitiformis]|uniref:Uncharacterized protein n=1 Tax=Cymbomonas tetramitiformis TaxID=36881 RepID=A0AAE0C351_9CHLO|nr:hypothetical protein CYMTET_43929 [Cymbomonas tetramitiformis]
MVSTGGDRYNVDLSRIITSDEAPNPLSATLAGHYGKVICGVGQKCNKVKAINKERISLDVYVGMDGTWYDPHLILGSKTVFENQIPAMQRDMDVLISTQANAFQDNSTLLSALQHLDTQLTQRRVKKPVLWLTDGQSARFHLKVLDFAEENGLVEFVYPPHTTTAHALLDRVFHMWHTTYSKSVHDWSKANPGKSVTKAVFAAVFPGAWDDGKSGRVGVGADGIFPERISDSFFVKSNLHEKEVAKAAQVAEEKCVLPPVTPAEGTFSTRTQKLEEENRRLREELLRLRAQPLSPEEIGLCVLKTEARIPEVGTSRRKAT